MINDRINARARSHRTYSTEGAARGSSGSVLIPGSAILKESGRVAPGREGEGAKKQMSTNTIGSHPTFICPDLGPDERAVTR